MDRKIILIELNEVPFRVLDAFCHGHPSSALSKVVPYCSQYETIAEDRTHLSPWKTWPSVHRGVSDEKHLIHDFGQDLREVDREFPPIWTILARNRVSTGVCGSLHSYPVPADLTGYSFYLPDTFAAGSECFPRDLELFQEFNLRMARDSARNVSSRIPWGAALRFLAAAPGLGLRISTCGDVVGQLFSEKIYAWKKARRRTYQAVLAFDIFMNLLHKTRPQFSTFFTNHVASSMHRFWAATFPEDYEEFGYAEHWCHMYRGEIDFAMSKFDEWFVRLVDFVDRNEEYLLWVTTSMGQAATKALPIETQLYVSDTRRFMSAMGLNYDEWSQRPAMLPQISIAVSEKKKKEFRQSLSKLCIDGRPITFRETEALFSIDFGHPNLYLSTSQPVFRGAPTMYELLGLTNTKIEDKSGTSAYHIPEGVLLIYDPRNERCDKTRTQVSTLDLAPTILHQFGVRVPEYMQRPTAIA